MTRNLENYNSWLKKYRKTKIYKQMQKRKYEKYKNNIIEKHKLYQKTPNGKYIRYKVRAKRSGLIFNITKDMFFELIYSPCYYCGKIQLPLNGVDRVNNNIGYEINNCVPCCSYCNQLKWTQTKEQFLNQIENIYKYRDE